MGFINFCMLDSRRGLVGTPGTESDGSKTRVKFRFCAIYKKAEVWYNLRFTRGMGRAQVRFEFLPRLVHFLHRGVPAHRFPA